MQNFIVVSTTRIWQLAAINLATIGLIILGLGAFGVAPALSATLWATARMPTQTAGQLVSGMWREYRREFINANLSALPFLALAAMLLVGAFLVGGVFGAVILTLAVMAAIQFVATLFVISRLSARSVDTFTNAKCAVAMAPYRLLGALLLAAIAVLISLWQPLLGVYFGFSAWAAVTNLIAYPAIAAGFLSPAEYEFNTQEARP